MIKQLLLATLLALSTTAFAAEKITLVWGFSPASNQANFYRALMAEMNKAQDKYEFLFETRPGAGGAIAAKYVLQNQDNTLFGTTSTFFIRANFDKETGYSTDSFQPVFVQTVGAPVALFSTKYKNIKDINKNTDLSVSISGFGSHSHLMASVLNELYPATLIVNYPSLVDANKDVIGQHINAGWNWLSEIESSAEGNLTTILGITGTREVKGYKTLASQGIRGFENASTNTSIQAGTGMSEQKVKEIYTLLREANKSPNITQYYAKEYSTPVDYTQSQTNKWYKDQVKFWQEQSVKARPVK